MLPKRKNCFSPYAKGISAEHLPEALAVTLTEVDRKARKGEPGREISLFTLSLILHNVQLSYLVYILFLMEIFRKDKFNENILNHKNLIHSIFIFYDPRKRASFTCCVDFGKLCKLSVAHDLIWKIGEIILLHMWQCYKYPTR